MLYLVGTPIGNLKEFNNYAVEILNKVDYILCEDTRTSSVLLNHYQIKKPLKSYHKFNEREMLNKVVADLENGKDVALISDAGMPAVSDPGNILVNEVKSHELEYTVISGPCALINAFIMSLTMVVVDLIGLNSLIWLPIALVMIFGLIILMYYTYGKICEKKWVK